MDSTFVPAASHLTPPCYSWSQIHQSGFFLDVVTVDSDHIVSDRVQTSFFKCCRPTKISYIWLLQNIQRCWPCWSHCQFGSITQYSCDKLVPLQDKFDKLEQFQVFRRPEDVRIKEAHIYFLKVSPLHVWCFITLAVVNVQKSHKVKKSNIKILKSAIIVQTIVLPWQDLKKVYGNIFKILCPNNFASQKRSFFTLCVLII